MIDDVNFYFHFYFFFLGGGELFGLKVWKYSSLKLAFLLCNQIKSRHSTYTALNTISISKFKNFWKPFHGSSTGPVLKKWNIHVLLTLLSLFFLGNAKQWYIMTIIYSVLWAMRNSYLSHPNFLSPARQCETSTIYALLISIILFFRQCINVMHFSYLLFFSLGNEKLLCIIAHYFLQVVRNNFMYHK